MHARTAATVALLALAALTAGCSGDSGTLASPAACKKALAAQLQEAMDSGKKGSQPEACQGLDAKTLEEVTGQVTADWLKSDDADQAFTDAMRDAFGDGIPVPEPTEPAEPTSAGIPVDCRAWLEDELLDPTDDIDATAGSSACSGLTDEEMNQAVEELTNDLIEQGAATP
ncbi:hypothetical protein ACFVGN_10640 [Streptomyces sp. NPDC057757]|uniref:hypothetical protein n=1 Tax=Streptomyces sp. NPDC057757 TaxID=3346241 RepID=UPI0036BC9124